MSAIDERGLDRASARGLSPNGRAAGGLMFMLFRYGGLGKLRMRTVEEKGG
jgi:hypothetical protein